LKKRKFGNWALEIYHASERVAIRRQQASDRVATEVPAGRDEPEFGREGAVPAPFFRASPGD